MQAGVGPGRVIDAVPVSEAEPWLRSQRLITRENEPTVAAAVRQGFYWWEIDLSLYALRALALLGIVWDLKPVPAGVRESGRLV